MTRIITDVHFSERQKQDKKTGIIRRTVEIQVEKNPQYRQILNFLYGSRSASMTYTVGDTTAETLLEDWKTERRDEWANIQRNGEKLKKANMVSDFSCEIKRRKNNSKRRLTESNYMKALLSKKK